MNDIPRSYDWNDDEPELDAEYASGMRAVLVDDPPFDNYSDLHYGAPWDNSQPDRRSEYTGGTTPATGGYVQHILELFDVEKAMAWVVDDGNGNVPYKPYTGLIDEIAGFI